MDSVVPRHRQVALLAFGPQAQGLATGVAAESGAAHLESVEAFASGSVATDLIVLVADGEDSCAGLDRVNAYAREQSIAMLALVLGATAASADGPAAVALRPVADTLVLTTDDELLAVMARWLERAD